MKKEAQFDLTVSTRGRLSEQADVARMLGALFETPELLPREMSFARDRVVLSPMTPAAYRDSAFLGTRLEPAPRRDIGLRLSQLVELYRRLLPPARTLHYLFHIGHCGSTLLSRMLGSLPGILSLREPPPLLELAQYARAAGQPEHEPESAFWRDALGLILSLLSRTFSPQDVAVVKPISHANNLMTWLLGWTAHCRGILLYVELEPYLATMLRPQARKETHRAVAQSRLADFHNIAGHKQPALPTLSDAQKTALVWLVEMQEFADVLANPSTQDRVRPLEFSTFLGDVRNQLAELAVFFDRRSATADIDFAIGPELAGQYSKTMTYPYDARRREQMLDASRRAYATEIADAIEWAHMVVRECPGFAALAGFVHGGAIR